MTPLFSPEVTLVAWLEGDRFIFDLDLDPIAFIKNRYVFSYPDCNWLGSVEGTTMQDRRGKPVAFSPANRPKARLPTLKPLKPLRPLKPLKPLRPLQPLAPLKPLTPLGGWSGLSFAAWINQ